MEKISRYDCQHCEASFRYPRALKEHIEQTHVRQLDEHSQLVLSQGALESETADDAELLDFWKKGVARLLPMHPCKASGCSL